MSSTTPPPTTEPTEPIELLELHRHTHGRRCWWNHLEARWNCPSTTA